MRYYFHTADGSRDRDTTGTELPNLNAARKQAIMFAGECMAFDPDILSDHHDFRVEVTDKRDMILFTIITLAVNAPSTGTT
ncbi:hypothetical protein Q4F19_20440 [Sphingomonas sp. BIUV-7]|uniref:DUF6894 domain-containing protein n=1 Tax=Sphingomonas natans TaxID=3063330 RepID=A0ABT8YEH1_9SPHN|nr:hypothetical protein [Sphingomonas sp. BIUV-7]MDO6416765.1 hypothetical protein [Sphingomonas sp. BIUV-7]